MVVELGSGAQNAVHDFRLHAIALHVLNAQMGIRDAADAVFAILVKMSFGHDVGAIVLAGNILGARWANPVHETEGLAVFACPVGSVRPVSDVGHALFEVIRSF